MHITFDQIAARLARHTAAEAARHTPKAAARRCVYELGSLLADLDAEDRASVLSLAWAELSPLRVG